MRIKKLRIKSRKKVSKIIYNIIIFTDNLKLGNKGYITYHKVNSLDKFIIFANQTYPDWKFATIYNNATREKIEVIKP